MPSRYYIEAPLRGRGLSQQKLFAGKIGIIHMADLLNYSTFPEMTAIPLSEPSEMPSPNARVSISRLCQ